MRKIILLIIAFIPLIAFCQSGGTRSLKTKSAKIVHSDLTGDNNVLIYLDSGGNEHKLYLDNTLTIENGFLKGTTNYVLPKASTTVLGGVKVDGSTIVSNDGIISTSTAGTGWNHGYQNLSGTTINYNVLSGINANITLSGNTTINMSNVQAGMVGSITIINDATIRTITFTGYTFKISLAIRNTTNSAFSSGNSNIDKFTWDYDGTRLSITGEYNLQ